MSAFNDHEHPRVADGTFTDKLQSSPEVSIASSATSPASAEYERRAASYKFAKEDMDRAVVAMMSEATLEQYPTATHLNIAYDNNDGYPYVSSITDAEGGELWAASYFEDGGPQAPFDYSDYLEELNHDPSDPTRIAVTPFVPEPAPDLDITIFLKGKEPSDDEIDQVLEDARAFGKITGRLYTHSSVSNVLDRLLEDEDEDEDILGASKADGFREAVWAHVQKNAKWAKIGEEERYDGELDMLDDVVRDGMTAVTLERAEKNQ